MVCRCTDVDGVVLQLSFFLSRQCPMHNASYSILRRGESLPELVRRRYAKETPETEYAFEMACSNIRYGPGVTQEVGMVSHARLTFVFDLLQWSRWQFTVARESGTT